MLSQMSLRDTITIDIFVLVDNKRKNLNTNIYSLYTETAICSEYLIHVSNISKGYVISLLWLIIRERI